MKQRARTDGFGVDNLTQLHLIVSAQGGAPCQDDIASSWSNLVLYNCPSMATVVVFIFMLPILKSSFSVLAVCSKKNVNDDQAFVHRN